MRPVLLISVILALIFMPSAATAVKQKPEKGYRRIKNLDAFLSNTVARFAEYDAPGCLDLFGKPKDDYKEFTPKLLKCYNIKNNDTVSIYHERGYMSQMWLYPGPDCQGQRHLERDWSCCQPVERKWEPYHVRSFKMN